MARRRRGSWSAQETSGIWPRPRKATLGGESALLIDRPSLFVHHSGCCGELLQAAFLRAQRRIFWAEGTTGQPPLPHLRVRASGVRTDVTPPNRRLCTHPAATFGSLSVEITNEEPTELQHGVDESYTLELAAAGGGGVLRAPTEWGALHGLETFSSLAHWTGNHTLLCALPLTVHDSPDYGWRGLLLDTSRHHVPVADSLLPLLDGMAGKRAAHTVPCQATSTLAS